MVVSQLYSCGLNINVDTTKPKPIAVKVKVWLLKKIYNFDIFKYKKYLVKVLLD